MNCETCQKLNTLYQNAVSELHMANQRVRSAKSGSVEAAVSRRDAQKRLHGLIKAEAELKSHTAAHVTVLPAVRSAVRGAVRF